ncbi:hypothetical protein ACEWY4_007163 [Coilia grayii]|uniref:Serotransferrin n=1 Tax=Coilia grayii TaxID=363190 RepID=A0ABD1KFY6_9TELE
MLLHVCHVTTCVVHQTTRFNGCPLFFVTALTTAKPTEVKVRWCVRSDAELKKCDDLSKLPSVDLQCLMPDNCLVAIKDNQADAITLDGGEIYEAGLENYKLHPIIAEHYGETSDTCYYAVAVVKKGSGITFNNLQGKKSCHTGIGKSAGWNIPIGTLGSMGKIQWKGPEDKALNDAVMEFFSESCAPGAPRKSKLCSLCAADCSLSHKEPYYDYHGAFQCLKDGRGDVAFVKHLTVPDSEKSSYELLCKDGSTAPIDSYKSCYLARVPAHAVVSRKDPKLAARIFEMLEKIPKDKLFSSKGYPSKNLMFKDSTEKLVMLPSIMDSFLYLGAEYMSTIRFLKKVEESSSSSKPIIWCAKKGEKAKCDSWAARSAGQKWGVECELADSVDDCLKMIMHKKADAVTVDGGEVYTAGKCGLVPVMVEQYEQECKPEPSKSQSSYHAVAVVKKGSGVTWENLKGKKSCHTGLGRTAGWNIPMGLIQSQSKTDNCSFNTFFSESCAPGADKASSLCSLCMGSGKAVGGDDTKCEANANEGYYGYAGAFRCLVDGKGDVAFVKHTIVAENTGENAPTWAAGVKQTDFQLIGPQCTAEIDRFADCHLAESPAHAVVTLPEKRADVVAMLKEHQSKPDKSGMFATKYGKNLLFKDNTKCLQELSEQNYKEFLGSEYMNAMTSLRKCSDTVSGMNQQTGQDACSERMYCFFVSRFG